MLIGFFLHLKSARLPVSTREFLTLLEALEGRVVSLSIDDFYHLARASLIKDEALFDRYDVAFATYFKGADALFDLRADDAQAVHARAGERERRRPPRRRLSRRGKLYPPEARPANAA